MKDCFGNWGPAFSDCFLCPEAFGCKASVKEAEYRAGTAIPPGEGMIVWAKCSACGFPSSVGSIGTECPECYEASLRMLTDPLYRERSWLRGTHGLGSDFDSAVLAWKAGYRCGSCEDALNCFDAYDPVCKVGGECLRDVCQNEW